MKKSFIATEVLCFLLGWLGVHRYYTGYIGIGVAQTLTLGGCGLWSLIDLIFISIGQYKDANGQELEDYNKNIWLGALGLVVLLAVVKVLGSIPMHRTVINIPSNSTTTKTETVEFGDTKCKVYKNGYTCIGPMTEAQKLRIKDIQMKMK